MKFNKINYPDGDPLKLVRIICLDIFLIKIVRFGISLIFVIMSGFQIVQTYLFATHLEVPYFLQFAHHYFMVWFTIISCLGVLNITPVISDIAEKIIVWNWKSSTSCYEEHAKNQFNVSMWIIANIMGTLFSGMLYAIPEEDDKNNLFMIAILEKYFTGKTILFFLVRFLFVAMSLIVPINLQQMYYLVNSTKLQADLIVEFLTINELKHLETKSEADLLSDEEYQQETNDNLKIAIEHSGDMIYQGRRAVLRLRSFIYFYAISGGFLAIGYIFFVLRGDGTVLARYVRPFCCLVMGFATAMMVMIAGQGAEDMTENIHLKLLDLNWYNWNQENKKMFLMLLIGTTKPFRINFSNNIAIDYSLGLTILKAIYSACSIFINMNWHK